jgi:hypothetical protein
MTEPLDADTLADIEDCIDPLRPDRNADVTNGQVAELLAVARDHARLTAQLADWSGNLAGIVKAAHGCDDPMALQFGAVAERLLAEAGDTDG